MTTEAAGLFDDWAGAGRAESMARGHWPMVSQILGRMELGPGLHCLDVGCGNGYAVRAMAQVAGEHGSAVGIDVSPLMIREAEANPVNPDNVVFMVSSADDLPFEDDRFDRILSVEAIYYMPDPGRALKEWYRVLKPGGSVWVMVDFYRENPYSECWQTLIEVPMQYRSEREYRELLETAGFTAVTSDRVFHPERMTPEEEARFQPGWGYHTVEDVCRFRTQIGSLLVSGKKSGLDVPDW